MEGTPPHPSPGGPPSMTPTARGHPHALRQCCNHRTCLAPPAGAHAGDLGGAALAWWQPQGSQLCPSPGCPGGGLSSRGLEARTCTHTFQKAKLPPRCVAPRLTLSDDPPLYLSFPICRGEVEGGPFGSSVSQKRRLCSFCTFPGGKAGGFALFAKALDRAQADWEVRKWEGRRGRGGRLTPLSSHSRASGVHPWAPGSGAGRGGAAQTQKKPKQIVFGIVAPEPRQDAAHFS